MYYFHTSNLEVVLIQIQECLFIHTCLLVYPLFALHLAPPMSWAMVHLLPVLFHNPCAQGRIWLKLAKQAEQRVRGTLEDLQKNMVGNPAGVVTAKEVL